VQLTLFAAHGRNAPSYGFFLAEAKAIGWRASCATLGKAAMSGVGPVGFFEHMSHADAISTDEGGYGYRF
jgi:hypothetical protein